MDDRRVSETRPLVFLRLFPLHVVLFPGQHLPLHIFEERYRTMIGECLAQKASFGVVLIERGHEVGGDAIVHAVGTSARIVRAERYPDGRMNLLVVGEHRFRIHEFFQHTPYPAARVVYLPPSQPTSPMTESEPLIALVRAEWERYNRLMALIEEGWEPMEVIPSTAQELAYSVASAMILEDSKKQALLEENNLTALLETESRLLADQNYRFAALLAARERLEGRVRQFGDLPKPFRLN